MPALFPEERERIENTLRAAFSYDSLRQMLRLKLGYKIEDELNVNRGFRYVVSDLVEIASGGWLDNLLLKADEYHNRGNFDIRGLIQQRGIQSPENMPPQNVNVIPANDTKLQQIIRKRIPHVNYLEFLKKLNAIAPQICRIEIQEENPKGTGWLVGADLVLTNYHVIETVDKRMNGLAHSDIFCRFDYHENDGQRSHVYKLATSWLVDKSPYSQVDLQPSNQDPRKEELDYALLRLETNPGEQNLNGSRRGWIKVAQDPPVMSLQDIAAIPQHPRGEPLQLAFGQVINYNTAVNRVRYDTDTDHGSSGSPCFDLNLEPFALHHASGPNNNLPSNQGVPLREIIKLMKTKENIPAFWT